MRIHRHRHSKQGFTLIELLLASMITTLVIGSGFISMSILLKAYKNESGKTDLTDRANIILERMRNDITATFISPHEDVTRFVGTDFMNGQIQADTLTFISQIHNPLQSAQTTSDLTEIQYFIDNDDETPERWLIRRYDPTPDDDPFSGGTLALLGPDVYMLNFEYFDGEMWWPTWDSNNSIPIAVNVTIGFFQPDFPGEEMVVENMDTFSTTIWTACYREVENANITGETGEPASGQ